MKADGKDRNDRTVRIMVEMYCRRHHGERKGLCPRCGELLAYTLTRTERCPHGDEKPNCADCTVHCYRRDMQEQIRSVMRFAGPRMLLRHPVLAVRHHMRGSGKRPGEPKRDG